ncbi:MAG: molybdopterin-dependent oxidoreductase [Candidatus Sulfotelmatobacter sp.]
MLSAMLVNMPAKTLASGILCVILQAALAVGMSAAAADTLQLRTPSHDPINLTAADLKALPHITVTIRNSHTDADETYAGVRLADLFMKMKLGAPLGSELRGKALSGYIVATGSDGYRAVLALAEIDPSFHPGEVLVADLMNGKPLDEHSGPFKLVVTEDKRPARSVRNLVSLELKMAD